MRTHQLVRLAGITRPFMRYRTPVLHRLCKWLLLAVCPKAKRGEGQELIVSFDGGLIHVRTDSSIEYHLLFRGCHEPALADLMPHWVRPGAVCLDVGANIGAHTLLMARLVGPTGRVAALEPHPKVCRRLRQNVTLNGYKQVHVVEAALADSDGEAPLYGFSETSTDEGISSLSPDEQAADAIPVRTLSGRALEREMKLTHVDFVKIDVEGAERIALEQLAAVIERDRPIVVFEYRARHWAKFGASVNESLAAFRRRQYALYYLRKNTMCPVSDDVPESCEVICLPEPAGR